jgi:hypothetical protein
MSLPKSLNRFNALDMDMEAAIQAFKDWRANRKKISRIPAHLWEIAANLSIHCHYPINLICKNLGLNWGTLKKKIDQLSANVNHPVKPQNHQYKSDPSFIELKLNHQGQSPIPYSFLLNQSTHSSPCNHSPRCAIELTKPDGTVMKIFASTDAPVNPLEFFKTFLGPETGGKGQ